jgi:glycosyltransferase involved in cell wall biosynthesis
MFNLAVFTDTFDDINGVAVIYRNLIRVAESRLETSDHLTMFCPGPSTTVERHGAAEVRHYRARPSMALPRYRPLRVGWVPRERVARDFAAVDHQAVLVATPGPMGLVGQRLARRHNLPLIGFYHTRFPIYLAVYARGVVHSSRLPALAERLGYRVMRRVYGSCDLIIAQSSAMAPEVARATDAPLAVWDTGVDLAAFRPGPGDAFRAAHGIPPDATVVVYIGRLAAEKNLDTLAALSRRMPDLTFLVVGDGPYTATLQAIARATFTGFLTGDALAEAYRAGDLFLFPSTTDTFGNVLVEAMASGLPLVVVDQGPPADLVARSGAGLVYSAGDLDAAERAVRRLADDPAERAAMSERARTHARQHDWPVAYERFFELCRRFDS